MDVIFWPVVVTMREIHKYRSIILCISFHLNTSLKGIKYSHRRQERSPSASRPNLQCTFYQCLHPPKTFRTNYLTLVSSRELSHTEAKQMERSYPIDPVLLHVNRDTIRPFNNWRYDCRSRTWILNYLLRITAVQSSAANARVFSTPVSPVDVPITENEKH
jgi:hypothetical protein